jgi:F0F1-type ATP synthase membrane subunit b/b'
MFLFLIVSGLLPALAGGETTPWWDYPGFELWKFVNLGIFVLLLVFILTRKVKLAELFNARRAEIKRQLDKARTERDAALQKLKEVEERLSRLDGEVTAVKEQSAREAAEERQRIAQSTEAEVVKLGEQAAREIETAGKVARKELRLYAAEQSVRRAEEIVRREMKPEDDARLIANNIDDLGGAAQ